MSRIVTRNLGLAALLATLAAGAAVAQTAPAPGASPAVQLPPPAAPAAPGAATGQPNPHEMMGDLSGGPAGSPTAERGNPRPGTSTSIPTTNPAPVIPLAERTGGTSAENTGIAGQCDPNVSLGNCPPDPAAAQAQAAAATASTSVEIVDYRCDGDQTLQVAYVLGADGTNFAVLLQDGRLTALPQAVSASGAIYGPEGSAQLLTKGDEATLESAAGEAQLANCRR